MAKCSMCKKKLRGVLDPCGNCVMEIGRVAASCKWTIKSSVVHRPCRSCKGVGKQTYTTTVRGRLEYRDCDLCAGSGFVPALADAVLHSDFGVQP